MDGEKMDYPHKVFISHKVSDRGDAARALAHTLNLYADKDKLDIFVSPEIQPGEKWNQKVHQKLREAHLLILLYPYSAQSKEMDWCLYETGFFAAATEGRNGKLICVVPKGVVPPGPLGDWQNIEMNPKGIKALLEAILKDKERPAKSELFEGKNIDDLNLLVKKTLQAIGPAEVRVPLSPRIWITIPGDKSEGLRQGKIPDNAWVKGETEALRDFGMGPTDGIAFNDLYKKVEFKDSLPFFATLLALQMSNILDGRSGPFNLEPIRVMKEGGPRNLIFTYYQKQLNGDLQFEFVVSHPSMRFRADTEDDFTMVYHLVTLAYHFHWRVIQKNWQRLNNLMFCSEPKTIASAFSALKLDLDTIFLDSFNRGLQFAPQVMRPFEINAQAYAMVKEIVRPRGGLWENAATELYGAMEESNIEKAIKSLKQMQNLNKTFALIASRRFTELLAELPGEVLDKKFIG